MGAYDNTVLVMMADGFEEIEALTVVDLLRRAGIDVKMVSIYGNNNDRDDKYVVKGARGISVVTDTCIDDSFIVDVFGSDVPLFVLPGGMPGTTNLKNDKNVETLIMDQFNKGRYVAAICAAPTVFGAYGILDGKKATCYPGREEGLGDAEAITEYFDKGEVSKIYLNFSDPWPKKCHAKRRLTFKTFLDQYRIILTEDGNIEQKTDNRHFFEFSLESFNENGWRLHDICLDLHNETEKYPDNITTEFEDKWSKLGPIYRLVAEKK